MRKHYLPLLILVLCLAVRLIFIATLQAQYFMPDEVEYDAIARQILSGQGYGTFTVRAPLYSFFLAGIYFLTGPHFIAVRIVQCFLDTFSAFLLMCLGRYYFRRSVGLLTAAIYAIYPYFVFLTGMLLSETVFIFLLLGCLSFATLFEKTHNKRFLIFSAIVLGFATLTRSITLFLIIPLGIWFAVTNSSHWKQRVAHCFTFVLLAFLVILPWTLRNYYTYGHFVLINTGGGTMLWHGNGPEAHLRGTILLSEKMADNNSGLLERKTSLDLSYNEAQEFIRLHPKDFNFGPYFNYERDQYLLKDLKQYFKKHPGIVVGNYMKKLVYFWSPMIPPLTESKFNTSFVRNVASIAYLFVFLFFIVGFLMSLSQWKRYLLLYLSLLSYVGAIALFTIATRYRVPMDPILILFAALGFHGICHFAEHPTIRQIHLCMRETKPSD